MNRVSERPAISPLAQAQLRLGTSISTQLHRSMKLPDAASKHFLSLLDGTRDLDALTAEMIAFITSARAETEGEKPAEDAGMEAGVKERVKNNLVSLMRSGMLVASQRSQILVRWAPCGVAATKSCSCSSRLRKAYVAANPSVFLHTWPGRAKA